MLVRFMRLTGKTIEIKAEPSDTISDVKEKIQNIERIPPQHITLSYEEKRLEDNHVLSDYNIKEGTTVFFWTKHK